MWKNTEVARRLGLAAPIIQGPFGGGISSVDLVVAVCETGGLGSSGVHHLDANGIRDVASRIRARTSGPFAINDPAASCGVLGYQNTQQAAGN